ncbi:VacJ family lipoprotein [Ramlibacter sp.]|uniref:MlaA family lipoprotein n=1 Tax=Ramlibacter sp. TaxID=1917967 RepID=UPI002B54F8FF|nr:VacJ family lipoprotein [Ramlibacter sp.]HWI84564.1 VacJ family lipoprotein [Ramlibacter sp.]
MKIPTPISPAAAPRRALFAVAALLLGLLAGCASGPNANPRDPFEPFNRKMMEFNEAVDAVALKPAATAYRNTVPGLARTGVSNFFGNLRDVWSAVNSALQLKFHNAAENILRFEVNTVFGFAGILDIASELNIERHKEDLGQTLGRWGVPAGPYLMLPFFGPSTVRDAAALPFDRAADPLHQISDWDVRWSLYTLRAVDQRADLLRVTSVLSEASLDKYSFTRDAHLQRRRAEIYEPGPAPRDGRRPGTANEPPSRTGDGYIPPEPEEDSPPPAR